MDDEIVRALVSEKLPAHRQLIGKHPLTDHERAALYCMRLERWIPEPELLTALKTCVHRHLMMPREKRLEQLIRDIYRSRFFDTDAALEDEDLDLVSRIRDEIQ